MKALLVTTEEGGDFHALPLSRSVRAVHSVFFDDGSIWDATIAHYLPETGGWRNGPDAKSAAEIRHHADRIRGVI